MIQLYACLGVRLNEKLLLEQTGVLIDDHVNRPCRVTVSSALPENGAEFDGRFCLGEKVRIEVLILKHHKISSVVLDITGKIIEASLGQNPEEPSFTTFTVEADAR